MLVNEGLEAKSYFVFINNNQKEEVDYFSKVTKI